MDNNTDKSLVTIITVVFNNVDTIERTIQSVVNQSYKNIEYIIIDGVSTDGTLDVIDKYKASISKIISEKDKGIADAMNKGIALANGKLVGLINADDWFETTAIEDVVDLSLTCPDAVIHGDMRIHMNPSTYYVAHAPTLLNLKKGMEMNHPTTFVPRILYERLGGFNINYKIVFDWELMLRFKLAGVTFIKLNKILSNFSVGGVSTVGSKRLIKEMHFVRKDFKVYKLVDYYYLVNRIRSVFFGSNVIRISQKIRLLKYKLSRKTR